MTDKVEHRPHCGICQVPVTDFKAHTDRAVKRLGDAIENFKELTG